MRHIYLFRYQVNICLSLARVENICQFILFIVKTKSDSHSQINIQLSQFRFSKNIEEICKLPDSNTFHSNGKVLEQGQQIHFILEFIWVIKVTIIMLRMFAIKQHKLNILCNSCGDFPNKFEGLLLQSRRKWTAFWYISISVCICAWVYVSARVKQ